jgi:hypothetical protein
MIMKIWIYQKMKKVCDNDIKDIQLDNNLNLSGQEEPESVEFTFPRQ